MAVTPTEFTIMATLRSFLLSILPSTVAVVRGQTNRVPEPQGSDFIVAWPTLRERLATNIDTYNDAYFTASIASTTMTVSQILIGTILAGSTVFGSGVATATTVVSQLSGLPGLAGTYQVSQSQTLTSSNLSAGTATYQMSTKATFQLDVHGPNSGDNVQIISTMFHDDYADNYFANTGVDVEPLYASDPRQMPFINAEQQYEERWVIDLVIETFPIIVFPQQFAGAVNVVVKEVDATYHP